MGRTFNTGRRLLLRATAKTAPRHRDRATPTPFVVLSTQRTGSTWLVEHLHAHPSIFMFAELFLNEGDGLPKFVGDGALPFFNTYARKHEMGGGWLSQRRVLREYLDEVYQPREGIRATGFKLMYSQVPRIFQLMLHLARRRAKVVHLVRRNLVDVFLSKKAREQRGFAHSKDAAPVTQVRLTIDPAELLAFAARITREHASWRTELDRAGLERCELTYEDLAADTSRLDDAVRFLGFEPVEHTEPMLQKLARTPHDEQIENYDEVARTLEGTPYENMLGVS
ncbi:MAG: hypothetical protein GY711_07805 [bacterium]|nr:hypothetical protein [bacterium]